MGNKNVKIIPPWNIIILLFALLSALAACEKLGTLIDETEIPVTGVSLNKTQASLLLGGSEQLVATVTPQDASNQNVTWTSSNASAASVTSSGLVTGNAAGTADIVVTTQQKGFQATCKVTVTEAPLGSTVAAPSFSLNGGTYAQSQTVTLQSDTAGASFKYTTDGSDPKTSPTAVEGNSVFVSMPITIKAYAFSGSAYSEVSTSFAYTITSGIVFVSPQGNDTYQGTVKFPKKTIASGIALADSLFATGEVRVAQGVYTINSQIDLKEGISLYGSYLNDFSGRSLSNAVTTIQDGRTSGECTAIAGSSIGNATVFDGFTVKGASTDSGSSTCIGIGSSSLSIRNNTFLCGTATAFSVGISMASYSSPFIYNNIIYGGNAGSRNIKIIITQGSNPKIYNNTLIADTGTRRYVIQLREDSGGSCHPTLKNNLFIDFASNSVASTYYGVYHMDSGTSHYPYAYTTNLFYVSPDATGDGAYVYYSGTNPNNINVNNYTTKPAYIYPSGSNVLTYNDPAWRNLVQDPLFLNPASGDFHLQTSSPARNAGTDLSAEIPPYDRDGKIRTAPWSIGAYEKD